LASSSLRLRIRHGADDDAFRAAVNDAGASDIYAYEVGPRAVEFNSSDEPGVAVTISALDVSRLVDALRTQDDADATAAADRIAHASKLGPDTIRVTLAIGEDERALEALRELRTTGHFLSPLDQLERHLQTRIDREGG
jgi:hypothetical protein